MKYNYAICILALMTSYSCSNKVAEGSKEPATTVQVEEKMNEEVPSAPVLTSEPGTVFYDITIEEALEKAAKEGKMVLVDCHTSSCGPCQKMEEKVFPQEACGEYINQRFVPIMIDCEEERHAEFCKKNNIQIYPTYLILTPEGKKEGEIIGAKFDVDKFLDLFRTIMHEN